MYKLIIYKKSKVYKVVNSVQYLKNFAHQKKYTCHAPKFYISVDAHGNVFSCANQFWGNIKETDFNKIFGSMDFKRFCKLSEKCHGGRWIRAP